MSALAHAANVTTVEDVQQPMLSSDHIFLCTALALIAVLAWSNRSTPEWLKNIITHTVPLPCSPDPNEGAGEKLQSSKWFGTLVPIEEFCWETTEPRKIYKFNQKFYLTMGLQSTDASNVVQIDRQYAERCVARKKIIQALPSALTCLPGAEGMTFELYEFLVQDYLPVRYPSIFKFHPDEANPTHVFNSVTKDLLPLTPPADPREALRLMATNMDEDFLMLLPSADGDGYALRSVIWCYPVGFAPHEKVGLKLRDAHQPVPGYKDKLQTSMYRYFARLPVGKFIYRVNWAVATNDKLYVDGEYHLYDGQESIDSEVDISQCFVRCELQTLFALPKSGGRILSVHLYLYPLQQIKDEGLAEEMVAAIDGLKTGNVPEYYRYKRAPVWHEKVKEFLLQK